VDLSQRRAGGILLAVFATLVAAATAVGAFVPLVHCPSPGAFRTGTVEFEGREIYQPHVQFWKVNGETHFTTPCPRCKGTARVTLINKWFGKDIQPPPPQ
jgi:hypothetical protein